MRYTQQTQTFLKRLSIVPTSSISATCFTQVANIIHKLCGCNNRVCADSLLALSCEEITVGVPKLLCDNIYEVPLVYSAILSYQPVGPNGCVEPCSKTSSVLLPFPIYVESEGGAPTVEVAICPGVVSANLQPCEKVTNEVNIMQVFTTTITSPSSKKPNK